MPKLSNARADAQAMAGALREMGFDVTLRTDLDDRGMREAMRTFKSRLSGGSEAVFYFAGHGVQLGAANYLLPTNINADNEEQVKDDGLPLQRVLDDLTEQKARFSVAIIDACRDNPFPRVAGRSIGTARGLAPTTAATGQMVLFSAGSGQSALDKLGNSDRDPNGLFTRVLLKEMRQPGVAVDQVLKRTRTEVVRLAKSVGHEQVPALYDQTVGEFYFRPPVAGGTGPAYPPADALASDRLFWESVKDSRRPEELRAYLKQFPNGVFAPLASSRLRTIEALEAPQSRKVTLPADVHFERGSTALTDVAKETLNGMLSALPNIELEVIITVSRVLSTGDAHADQVAVKTISESVRGYLIKGGVDPRRIYSEAQVMVSGLMEGSPPRWVQLEAIGVRKPATPGVASK